MAITKEKRMIKVFAGFLRTAIAPGVLSLTIACVFLLLGLRPIDSPDMLCRIRVGKMQDSSIRAQFPYIRRTRFL